MIFPSLKMWYDNLIKFGVDTCKFQILYSMGNVMLSNVIFGIKIVKYYVHVYVLHIYIRM